MLCCPLLFKLFFEITLNTLNTNLPGAKAPRRGILHFEWENVAAASGASVAVALVVVIASTARKSVAGGDQTISVLLPPFSVAVVLAIRSINLFPMDFSAQKTSDVCSSRGGGGGRRRQVKP